MKIRTVEGVVYFHIGTGEIKFLPEEFFKNKKFIRTSDNLNLYGYNFEWPTLLIKGVNYFGAVARRTFFSSYKEEIFKELGVGEREEGIFLNFIGNRKKVVNNNNYFVFNGFLNIFDLIDNRKVKQFNYEYDVISKQGRGSYGF